MITIGIIGVGSFGSRIIEQLEDAEVQIIIADKDRAVIEKNKNKVQDAYITDVINNDILKKIIPDDVSAVVVDLGSNLETSILVTNYLHKMGVKQIIVKASNDEHGEILKLVGATMIVYPDLDAAQRITPILISSVLFNYMQISPLFALAEVKVKDELVGKTLQDSSFRQLYHLNVVATRKNSVDDFSFISSADFVFERDSHLLVAGTEDDLHKYLESTEKTITKKTIINKFFHRK